MNIDYKKLTEQEIKQLVIRNNRANSEYDFKIHRPYPTLTYLRNRTGIDLITLEGTEYDANAKLRLFTDKAWDLMMYGKHTSTVRTLEFLIAINEDYRGQFILYVVNLIADMFFSGNLSALMGGGNINEQALKAKLNQGPYLSAYQFVPLSFDYRKGY